jgi:hypothetical protein
MIRVKFDLLEEEKENQERPITWLNLDIWDN